MLNTGSGLLRPANLDRNGARPRWKKTPETQSRSLDTRQDLLEAARQIFARAGFEIARIEEIARVAGKTRGAFYAHFRDKEDIFLAVFEDELACDRCSHAESSCISISTGREIRITARQLVLALKNKRRWLLHLELYLHAHRTFHRSRRLSGVLAGVRTQSPGDVLAVLFAAFDADSSPEEMQRSQSFRKQRALQPVLQAARDSAGRKPTGSRNAMRGDGPPLSRVGDHITHAAAQPARRS